MAELNLRPLADKVIVRPKKEEEKTKSGIVLPATGEKDKPEQGEVVAVGPGKMTEDGKLLPMSIKVGQTVVFTQYGPTEIKMEGTKYLVLSEGDILAVIE